MNNIVCFGCGLLQAGLSASDAVLALTALLEGGEADSWDPQSSRDRFWCTSAMTLPISCSIPPPWLQNRTIRSHNLTAPPLQSQRKSPDFEGAGGKLTYSDLQKDGRLCDVGWSDVSQPRLCCGPPILHSSPINWVGFSMQAVVGSSERARGGHSP